MFGPRGGQYSLRDQKRKHEVTEVEQKSLKPPVCTSVDASTLETSVEPIHQAQYLYQMCSRMTSDVMTALNTINKRIDAVDSHQSRLTSLLEKKNAIV